MGHAFQDPSWWPSSLHAVRGMRFSRTVMVLLALLMTFLMLHDFSFRQPVPPSSTFGLSSLHTRLGPESFLARSEAESLCNASSLEIYPERGQHRKIYDLFLLGTELDWLEIRLNELAPLVDYFVIVESVHTFTEHVKPLFLRDHWSRFAHLGPQIIHRVVETHPSHNDSTWDREQYLRNSLLDAVFPSLLGDQAPNLGDVLLVSDVDEIPKPDTLTVLRNCNFPERTTLRSHFFYYSFQWQHKDGDWWHPQATFYQGDSTIKPEDLRGGASDMELHNSSWHCSSCFSTVAELQSKIGSFSHTEYDQPEFKDPAQIVRRVRHGLDLFDRESEHYERVDMGQNLPQYLVRNRDRFRFMLDRDPLNANFQDYPRPH